MLHELAEFKAIRGIARSLLLPSHMASLIRLLQWLIGAQRLARQSERPLLEAVAAAGASAEVHIIGRLRPQMGVRNNKKILDHTQLRITQHTLTHTHTHTHTHARTITIDAIDTPASGRGA
jgi:hypothetical protein